MTGGEILGYFKNGEFPGFGGGAPDCRSLDVLYAIHQLTITFVTYIFKITSLTFLFFRRARKKSFL